jgi:hypothetical protein
MDVELLSHFIGTLVCTLFTPIWVPHTQDGRKWHVEVTFHHFERWIFLGMKPCKLLRPIQINKSSADSSWSKRLEGGDWTLGKINSTKGININ